MMAETWNDKSRALAALSVSNLRAQPDHASELVSQVLMGTPMKALDSRDNWYQVQTPEAYSGWMDARSLHLLTEQEMESWKKSERYFYNAVSGYAYDATGEGETVTDLVLGDLFEGKRADNGYLKISLPDGRTGYAREADCISFNEWIALEPDVEALLAFAKRMMGFPYLWGGASSKALDCSGFTKLLYYTQGIILARDASQQARYGEPVDFNRTDRLKPGDLLFFGASPERIVHVGIYISNGEFIHSSGRVHIASIIPGDPKYDPNRNLVAARRIFKSLDTEGITRVRNHKWYK